MDPISAAVILGALAVGGFAWLARRPVGNNGQAPDCGTAAQVQAVGATVGAGASGAAAGAPAGPVGAGVGAGLGVALATTSAFTGPCGGPWSKAAKDAASKVGKDACKQADEIYSKVKQAGGEIPGYSNLNCDQKLAAAVAAAGTLLWSVPGLIAVGAVQGAAERTAKNVTDTNTSVSVGGGEAHATVGGHKLF